MAIRAVVLSLVCVGTVACWSPLEDGAAANAGGEAAAATPLSTGNGSSGGAGGAGSVSASNMWCTSELEVCNNRTDDDCDGVMDCDDPDCAGNRACRCPNAAEFETCGNGVDDDCDGTVDCEDTECASTRACVCPNAAAVETCDNGGDDDCDGAVDCLDADCSGHSACTRDCTSSEGNNCNGDMGYGDHCATADNENGCSAARFWAWCNRRNPAYPDIWDNHLRGWVDDRCDGNVDVTQEQYAVYFCTGSNGTRWQCRTPLVLVMEQDQRVMYRAYAPGAAFDFSGNGARDGERHDWPTRATPWLALDLNGNGRIDSARELFGTASPGEPVNGFLALAALDANHDGVVDAKDPQFHRLLAWRDDGDRVSQKRELVTVASLGIRQLPLSYVTQSRCDLRGNCEVERAPLEWRDRAGVVHTGALVDVHLRVQDAAVAPLVAARR